MFLLACIALAALLFVPLAVAREECSEAGGECPPACAALGLTCSPQDAGSVSVEAGKYVCRKTQDVGCDWLGGPNACPEGMTHDDGVDGVPDCGIPVLNVVLEPIGLIKTHFSCHADWTSNCSASPSCRAGYKRVRQEKCELSQPAVRQCCEVGVASPTPPPAPCEGVECEDVCDGFTRKEGGSCNPATGRCVYQFVQPNSTDCGYQPPLRLRSLFVQPHDYVAAVGEEVQFNATGYDSDLMPLSETLSLAWNVSNSSRASVSGEGLFTASAPGEVYVCALHEASNLEDCGRVQVISLADFALVPSSPVTVLAGTRVPFMAKGRDALTGKTYGLNPVWEWNGTSGTTVEPSGTNNTVAVLTASSTAGNGTVKAVQRVGSGSTAVSKTASASVTIVESAGEPASLEIIPHEEDVPAQTAGPDLLQLYVLVRDASGVIVGGTPSWTSSNTTVGTITSDGLFSPRAAGETVVTASLGELSDEVTITVGACVNGRTRECAQSDWLQGIFTTARLRSLQTCNASRVFGPCYLDPAAWCTGRTECTAEDGTCSDAAKCGPNVGQPIKCCDAEHCTQFTDPHCRCERDQRCTDALSGCWGLQRCVDGGLSSCAPDSLCLGGDTGVFNVLLCAARYDPTNWTRITGFTTADQMQAEAVAAGCAKQGPWSVTERPEEVERVCYEEKTFLMQKYNSSDRNFNASQYAWNASPAPEFAHFVRSPNYYFFLDENGIPHADAPSSVLMFGVNTTSAALPQPAVFVPIGVFTNLETYRYQIKLLNASYSEGWANFTYRYWNCT